MTKTRDGRTDGQDGAIRVYGQAIDAEPVALVPVTGSLENCGPPNDRRDVTLVSLSFVMSQTLSLSLSLSLYLSRHSRLSRLSRPSRTVADGLAGLLNHHKIRSHRYRSLIVIRGWLIGRQKSPVFSNERSWGQEGPRAAGPRSL